MKRLDPSNVRFVKKRLLHWECTYRVSRGGWAVGYGLTRWGSLRDLERILGQRRSWLPW